MRWRALNLCIALLLSAPAHADEAPGLVPQQPTAGRSVATDKGYMVPYTEKIPGTEITFEMIPIPGGEFIMGSPEDEVDHNDDEGPQVRVKVAPFWIGKCEITWAEYQAYMAMYEAFKSLNSLRDDQGKLEPLDAAKEYLKLEKLDVDGVTTPTPLYDSSFTYAAGEEPEQPAVTMTQFAAKQYTKWLSGITGREYRLPTEAEWEYAARAGSTTAYSFGDDAGDLGDYAWFDENSDYLTHAVGEKKPNAWGLHDMHGNVAEWVLDEYIADHYASLNGRPITAEDAVAWPTKLYPRAIRGGSWFDPAPLCRTAARHKSDDPEWNTADPNLPKSPWWFTEDPATGVGFRIVRPLTLMDDKTKPRVWEADLERISDDVADRLDEGRGAKSAADPRLPAAVDELRDAGMIEQ